MSFHSLRTQRERERTHAVSSWPRELVLFLYLDFSDMSTENNIEEEETKEEKRTGKKRTREMSNKRESEITIWMILLFFPLYKQERHVSYCATETRRVEGFFRRLLKEEEESVAGETEERKKDVETNVLQGWQLSPQHNTTSWEWPHLSSSSNKHLTAFYTENLRKIEMVLHGGGFHAQTTAPYPTRHADPNHERWLWIVNLTHLQI